MLAKRFARPTPGVRPTRLSRLRKIGRPGTSQKRSAPGARSGTFPRSLAVFGYAKLAVFGHDDDPTPMQRYVGEKVKGPFDPEKEPKHIPGRAAPLDVAQKEKM